jgi:hypothetical protein
MAINQKAVVTVTMASTACQFVNNTFAITQPIPQTLFTNGCYAPPSGDGTVGTVYTLTGTNSDKSFPAATTVQARFTQGIWNPSFPPKGAPAIQVTGGFPDWTLGIDDGGNINAKLAGTEPKFQNIVLTVHAAVVP